MAPDADSSQTTTATVLRATERQVRLQLEGGREVTKRVTVPADVRESIAGKSVPVVVTGTGERARVELGEHWLEAAGGKAPAKRSRSRAAAKKDAPADKAAAKQDDAPAEKAPAKTSTRRRGAKKDDTAKADDAPAKADDTAAKADDAPKKRTRSRSKAAAPQAAVTPPAEPEAAEVVAVEAEATPAQDAPKDDAPKKRSRSRSRGRSKAKAAAEPKTGDDTPTETPGDEAPQAATPAGDAPTIAETAAQAPPAPAVAVIDPATVRERIAAAVELVRAARR
jgi:hypothetical protein